MFTFQSSLTYCPLHVVFAIGVAVVVVDIIVVVGVVVVVAAAAAAAVLVTLKAVHPTLLDTLPDHHPSYRQRAGQCASRFSSSALFSHFRSPYSYPPPCLFSSPCCSLLLLLWLVFHHFSCL